MNTILEVIQPVTQIVEIIAPEQAALVEVNSGLQGIAGPPGKDGANGSAYISLPTNKPISGHKLVVTDDNGFATYVDCRQIQHANRVVGLTVHAVTDNGTVSVLSHGDITDASFNFSPGAVFIGIDGELTQLLPVDAVFVQQIGVALSHSRLFVSSFPAIVFS